MVSGKTIKMKTRDKKKKLEKQKDLVDLEQQQTDPHYCHGQKSSLATSDRLCGG